MRAMGRILSANVVLYFSLTIIEVASVDLLEIQPCGKYTLRKGDMLAIKGSNTSCQWIFKGPKGSKVEAVCSNIHIPKSRRCSRGSLTISVLPGKKERRLCGKASRRQLTRRTRKLTLRNKPYNGVVNTFKCDVFLTYPPNSTTSHCRCGEENSSERIVGGVDAGLGIYGWVAGIRYVGMKNYFCMAFIVSDRHLITAAHCMPSKIKNLVVVASDYTPGTSSEIVHLKRRVDRVHYPPNHKPGRVNFGDLAIIELDHPIPLKRDSVTTVCLPPAVDPPSYANETGIVFGWGTTTAGAMNRPQHLQKVEVPIWSNKRCKETSYKDLINPSLLCAGEDEGGQDACQGDSGGSLSVKSPETRRHTAVGSVSFGASCGVPYTPGVYTRISYYRSWIEKKIASGLRCSYT